MDSPLEELRLNILIDGADYENQIEIVDASMHLFGPMEQSTGGKIKAGSLTDSRRDAYAESIKVRTPYFDWESVKSETKEAVQLPEDEDRKQFLKAYEDWSNTGSPVVASKLEYSDV